MTGRIARASVEATPVARSCGRHRARNAAPRCRGHWRQSRGQNASSPSSRHDGIGEGLRIVGDEHVDAIAQALPSTAAVVATTGCRGHAQVDLALDPGAVAQRCVRAMRARSSYGATSATRPWISTPCAATTTATSPRPWPPMQWNARRAGGARTRGHTSLDEPRTASTFGGWRNLPTNTMSWRCAQPGPGRTAGAGWTALRPAPGRVAREQRRVRLRSRPAWRRPRAISPAPARACVPRRAAGPRSPASSASRCSRR